MNKLILSLSMICSAYALGSQSANFTEIKSRDEFTKLMHGPTVYYLYSRASNKHHFSDQMHEQVVKKLKELASEYPDINFGDMEWSRPAEDNPSNPILYNLCLLNNKIEISSEPHFLFFYNMQELFRLIPSFSCDDVTKRMFMQHLNGKTKIQITGQLSEELGVFVRKLKEESKKL